MRFYSIQKHAARRLHYDLRLELAGVLKSWAVTKGPSLVAGERRLAVQVADHGLDYGSFEGILPAGYGAGTVLLWDRGTWEPDGDAEAAYAAGSLAFRLRGEKLTGAWRLVRMAPRADERHISWLFIKARDAAARAKGDPDVLTERPLSVLSQRPIEAIVG
jgi:DNA ligase D-like protein (predicted 3'-phosphoesterase)